MKIKSDCTRTESLLTVTDIVVDVEEN